MIGWKLWRNHVSLLPSSIHWFLRFHTTFRRVVYISRFWYIMEYTKVPWCKWQILSMMQSSFLLYQTAFLFNIGNNLSLKTFRKLVQTIYSYLMQFIYKNKRFCVFYFMTFKFIPHHKQKWNIFLKVRTQNDGFYQRLLIKTYIPLIVLSIIFFLLVWCWTRDS